MMGLGPILSRQAWLKALPVPAATSPGYTFSESWAESGWSCSKKPFPNLPVSRFSTIRPIRPVVPRLKEVLPSAARALGLTIQPWEVRDADDFERVFAALDKQRPDGL